MTTELQYLEHAARTTFLGAWKRDNTGTGTPRVSTEFPAKSSAGIDAARNVIEGTRVELSAAIIAFNPETQKVTVTIPVHELSGLQGDLSRRGTSLDGFRRVAAPVPAM